MSDFGVPVGNISRVLGRIKEIEAKVYPQQVEPDEPVERFQEVLDAARDDLGDFGGELALEETSLSSLSSLSMKEHPLSEPSGRIGTANKSAAVPSSLDERLAFWEDAIQKLSAKYEVDPDLVRAVMRCESGGNPDALSSAGAIGLMQLMPGTARGLGVDPTDPLRNLEGGIKYLAQLADKYDGDTVKTLAAYNAGSGRVDSYDGVPPFPETQRYVRNVLALYKKYSRGD